jgi:hypothetical protein
LAGDRVELFGVERAQGHFIGYPSLELPAGSVEESGRRSRPAV